MCEVVSSGIVDLGLRKVARSVTTTCKTSLNLCVMQLGCYVTGKRKWSSQGLERQQHFVANLASTSDLKMLVILTFVIAHIGAVLCNERQLYDFLSKGSVHLIYDKVPQVFDNHRHLNVSKDCASAFREIHDGLEQFELEAYRCEYDCVT